MIPAKTKLILIAARFYGTSNLVQLCQELGFGYRIRLKCNLISRHQGGELNRCDMGKLGLTPGSS